MPVARKSHPAPTLLAGLSLAAVLWSGGAVAQAVSGGQTGGAGGDDRLAMVSTAQMTTPGARLAAPALSAFTQAVAEDAAADPALAAFYAARDYRPLWTAPEDAPRRAALMAALDGAVNHGLPPGRYDAAGLRGRFAAIASERQRGRLEVAMSRAFLTYAQDVSSGVLDAEKVDAGIKRDQHRPDRQALITGFAAAERPDHYLRMLAPDMGQYARLMKARLDLLHTIAAGGWGPEVSARKLSPGDTGAAVVALRDRLQALGYLGRSATAVYDADIQRAVQEFQRDQGLEPDGVAGEGTLAEINRSPEDRLEAVLVALERMRWMNGTDLGARHVWVNLPDFTARIVDHGRTTFETVVVIGMNRADRRSPEFSDEMEHMIVNPSWSVPRSITVKEYLPMMQRNPNAASHINVIDRRGRVVPRSAIDFAAYNARSFPFAMRQPPSRGNALGLVKFMFPNPYHIYLHDTPSKSLFQREVRAFSHGCIRVGRPFDLAYALLAAQSDDPEGEFKRALNSGGERKIELEKPLPVHLVYFTAWPDARGHVGYRRDIYGRDGRIFEALRKAGVELRPVQG